MGTRDEAVTTTTPGRRWSLRREWSRAFAVMILLLLTAGSVAVLGVHDVIGDVQQIAARLDRESEAVASLRHALVDHEETAHRLLSDKPVDRPAFLRQQQEIDRQFDDIAAIFPVDAGMRATVLEAKRSWRQGLTTYRLWGDQLATLHGSHLAQNPEFGAVSDETRALLDGLQKPALAAMSSGLSSSETLETALIVTLIALFGLSLATTLLFRFRMARYLARPIARLHQGVADLMVGRFDHPIQVTRRDELGELAEAFNTMAAALRDSHVALSQRAMHDSLTGLANRTTLTERLAASLGSGGNGDASLSVLFIDIDDFKHVNDSLGHAGGDALLVQLAARLTDCVRPDDLVGRLGGDEFAILVSEQAEGSAVEVAERILGALRTPFTVGDTRLKVAVSIGVARRQPNTTDAEDLLRQADFAMYMAKGSGKNRYQLFDPLQHQDMVATPALRAELARAVPADQLRLHYQPIADLRTGRVVGVEALVRWQHPVLGLLTPAEFIGLAEESGHMEAIGCWILETATRQAAAWRRDLPEAGQLWLSVNLSALQLRLSRSVAAMTHILSDPSTEAERVVLEVAETALADERDGGVEALHMMKRSGVRLAIDDFGAGVASLSLLTRMPVDILKIDPAVSGYPGSSTRTGPSSQGTLEAILESLLGLAQRLDLTPVAEGIETRDQLDLLRELGYRFGQGYLLARPQPPAQIEELLASGGILKVPADTRA